MYQLNGFFKHVYIHFTPTYRMYPADFSK